MANGVAVRLTETPATAVPATDSGIEERIGEAMAAAVAALSKGVVEYFGGGLTPATKALGGDAVAKLFWLRQQVPDVFADIARREGVRALQARHGADFSPYAATVADETISGVLAVIDRVVEFERSLA